MAKILLVDDEQDIREMMRLMLEDEGHDVSDTGSGEEALIFACEGGFDLVILDIMMPDMNGWRVCGFLREDERTKTLPVLFCSGSPDAERMHSHCAPPNTYFITKPFETRALNDRVRKYLMCFSR